MNRPSATSHIRIILAALCILLVNGQNQNLCNLHCGPALNSIVERFNLIADQLIGQQLSDDERIRSEGGSGITTVRLDRTGTKNYHSASHGGKSKVGY